MKILLIAPSSGKWRQIGRSKLFNGKTFRFSLLSLLSVAAETPKEYSVQIVDEQFDDIPWQESFDLVGITCMTALAPRAYSIADHFRRSRVPVVLGGMHPTFCPQEALHHADAVVAGEAEGIWQTVLEDAQAGKLGGIYRGKSQQDLTGLKRPPYALLQSGYYSIYPVQATRGCPYQCAFCSVSAFNKGVQRQRPVEEVIAEITVLPSRSFIFIDDNLTADPLYAKQLFRALIPLRKRWITQSSLDMAKDEDLLRLASAAGCIGIFVGLETFSKRNLDHVNKSFNKVDHYKQAVRTLHEHGIGVEAGIVFGFDGDDASVFSKTLNILDDIEIDLVQVSIFTPLPGTRQFEMMCDRIIDRYWGHYDFHHVVFQPKNMSAEALQAGHDWVTKEFYRPGRIARRLARLAKTRRGSRSLPFAIPINGAYFGRIRRWNIQGWDPGTEEALKKSVRGAPISMTQTVRRVKTEEAIATFPQDERLRRIA